MMSTVNGRLISELGAAANTAVAASSCLGPRWAAGVGLERFRLVATLRSQDVVGRLRSGSAQ
jgi:hypothetical protein